MAVGPDLLRLRNGVLDEVGELGVGEVVVVHGVEVRAGHVLDGGVEGIGVQKARQPLQAMSWLTVGGLFSQQ